MHQIKILSLLYLFLCITISIAQNKTGLEVFVEEENLQPSPIKKIIEKEINLAESFGEIIQGNEKLKRNTTFNEEGYILEDTTVHPSYISENDLPLRQEYKYDTKGNHIESYFTSEIAERLEQYKYDVRGNRTEALIIVSSLLGESIIRMKYKYNVQGNKIEQARYNSSNTLTSRTEYKYDEQGNRIEMLSYSSNNTLTGKTKYKYDTQNNRIESLRFDYTSSSSLTSRIKPITDTPDNSLGKGFIGKTEYKHDELGNSIEILTYNSNSVLNSQTKCQYDEHDIYSNWTKRTCIKYVEAGGEWKTDYRANDDELTIRTIEYHQTY